jgi:subtilisin family serine protease
VLNATLPPASSATIPASPLLGEDGGIITAPLDIDWTVHQTADAFDEVVDPSTLRLDPSVIERLRAVNTQVRYLPVIVRLPVAYDALARGKALAAVTQAEPVVQKAGNIPVASTDPAIVAATKKLSDALAKYADWGTRSVQPREMYRAHQANQGKELAAAPAQTGQAETLVTGAEYVAQLGQTPYVRALLTVGEIEKLAADRLIVDAAIDGYATVELEEATEVIGSREPTTYLGYKGAGAAVAIIDTGVLASHPAFGSRIVRQRCYSGDESCANGRTSDTGSSSALPCTFHTKCDHGTHVAGIAAGAYVPRTTLASPAPDGASLSSGDAGWHAGVAPGASILAYRTASRVEDEGDRPGFRDSDFLLAAGDIAAVAARYNVAALNYSVGSEETFAGMCDADDVRAVDAYVDAIDTLRAANVAVVIAAGNEDQRDETSFPGCINEAVTVSATTDDDDVAGFSNVSEVTDLYAPGVDIVAASATGSTSRTATYEAKQGTSMAAPMVTGAWALVRSLSPTMNVASVLDMLSDRGEMVTDLRTGGSEPAPRLDLRGIMPRGTSTGASANRVFTGERLSTSAGTSLLQDADTGKWTGEIVFPAGSLGTGAATYAGLYLTVRGGSAVRVTTESRLAGSATWTAASTFSGSLLVQTGYSATPCRDLSPMRSYRVDVTGRVNVENRITITLDGAEPVADGASIFIVGGVLSSSTKAAVVVTEGLGVLNDDSRSMSASVPHSTPLDGRDVSVHLAVADGQPASESAVGFKTSTNVAGVTVTAGDLFSRADGPNWDDVTIDLSGAGLTGTPGLLYVTHDGVSATKDRDCLAVAAAMLNIGRKPTVVPDAKTSALGAGFWKPTSATVTPRILFAAPAPVRR